MLEIMFIPKDTLLVVHTLLLTFALATLQYSDQFVPVSGVEMPKVSKN